MDLSVCTCTSHEDKRHELGSSLLSVYCMQDAYFNLLLLLQVCAVYLCVCHNPPLVNNKLHTKIQCLSSLWHFICLKEEYFPQVKMGYCNFRANVKTLKVSVVIEWLWWTLLYSLFREMVLYRKVPISRSILCYSSLSTFICSHWNSVFDVHITK